jgi:hypothetical protein
MHVSVSWLKVEERLTASLLLFVQGIDVLTKSIYQFIENPSLLLDQPTFPT